VGGELGRFGAKAGHATLAEAISAALARDLGLATLAHPTAADGCTDGCGMPAAATPLEVSDTVIGLLTAYVESLSAPAAPAPEPLFAATGCATCHAPELPATGGGTVAAFTDLRLHDMGPGLDDGVAEPGVRSFEWRTAPLLDMAPRPARRYLHDGRAPSVAGAIAWHGGEAAAARARFDALSADEQARLIAYVEGL
jgi:CxxC motif-containing protein (DUF1111 family)